MMGDLFKYSLTINGASLVTQIVKNTSAMRNTRVGSLVQKDPWKREWLSTPIFVLGEFHGQRILAGYSPWAQKELDTTEQPTL